MSMRSLFQLRQETPAVFAWHPQGAFLATAGGNGKVQIVNRDGGYVSELALMPSQGVVAVMEWDKDGEMLAIMQDGGSALTLWEFASRRVTRLETNLKDLSFVKWSNTGSQLAVGSGKGDLLIYERKTTRKTCVKGKNPGRICAGAWSANQKLVLGSDDGTITVTNVDEDPAVTVRHISRQQPPLELCVGCLWHEHHRVEEATLSAILGRNTLMLCSLDGGTDPLELSFDHHYGELVTHCWLPSGLVALGFVSGQLVVLATNTGEIRQEFYSARVHPRGLTALAYNSKLKQIATAGPEGVKITNTTPYWCSAFEFIATRQIEGGTISSIGWSTDGQILTVSTTIGNVYNFLAKMPLINARYKYATAYLSSLREVTVMDSTRRAKQITMPLRIEPAFIAMGGFHIAAGMNNKVYYHKISNDRHDSLVNEQEYMGAVVDLVMNDQFAAVLAGGKVVVHPIESSRSSAGVQQNKVLPERTDGPHGAAQCIAITEQFLYYGTRAGTLEVYYLAEGVLLVSAEQRLASPARQIFPNAVQRQSVNLNSKANGSGTQLVVIDDNSHCWLVNPTTGETTIAPHSPVTIKTVLWDLKEQSMFSIFDGEGLHTYTYAPATMRGPVLSKIGKINISEDGAMLMEPEVVRLASTLTPLVAMGGYFTCQSTTGMLTTAQHPLFVTRSNEAQASPELPLIEEFEKHLVLLNIEKAWEVALQLSKQHYWLALSNKAMELLNVEYALRVYRHLGDAGMVLALEQLMNMEDRHLLAGHMALLFGDYQLAQDLFLKSSYPRAALEMRQDLLHWEQALKLALTLAPEDVPQLSVEYAQFLESRGQIQTAVDMFLQSEQLSRQEDKHLAVAWAGLARCFLRLGDLHEGSKHADLVKSLALYRECGAILEATNAHADAAAMYLKAEQYETTAAIYIRTQSFAKAAPIMHHVHSARLNKLFAQACERSGDYKQALLAYERAHDTNEIIRLYLETLNQPEDAFELVRRTNDEEGAALVATYCKQSQNHTCAIEFLLLAKQSEEAFEIARVYNLVDTFTELAGEDISNEDALNAAAYFEKQQAFGKAGRLYSVCGHYQKALNLFLQCGDKEINTAIEVVGKARSDELAYQLIDFLMGDKDGVVKDANYVYKLYMALGNYKDAAKTALMIAKQDHESGNYRQAREVLVDCIRQLDTEGIHVALHLRQSFELLHSYMLISTFTGRKYHMGAARMLIRVVRNISKFPLHYVNILTVAVIECARAGLQASAFEYAVMLSPPEYRCQIPEEHRRQIESRVRRRSQAVENIPEELSECPVSLEMIPQTQLECPTTKDVIPMCIITGRHIIRDDTCFCPNSGFPALYSEYSKYIQFEESKGAEALDPLLGNPIRVEQLRKVTGEEVLAYIRKYNDNQWADTNTANEQPSASVADL